MTKTERKAHAKAKTWFIKRGYDMTGKVLHHKDMSLKSRDPERYAEWRPSDLKLMTVQEHRRIHMKVENKKGTLKTRKHKKAISAGMREHYADFKGCRWRIWHGEITSFGVVIPAACLEFSTAAQAAKHIGCSKQLVCQAANPKTANTTARGWRVEKVMEA